MIIKTTRITLVENSSTLVITTIYFTFLTFDKIYVWNGLSWTTAYNRKPVSKKLNDYLEIEYNKLLTYYEQHKDD
jgi:hypothetical protein